jgi:hypothetical protein
MKVFITGTPDVSHKLIREVADLLNKCPGPLKFVGQFSFSTYFFSNIIGDNNDSPMITFDQIVNLCSRYRFNENLEIDSFVVVLSSKKLDFAFKTNKKWFSYFSLKDIVVRTYDWNEYTNNKPQIAIAYQIIENIFQSLSGYQYNMFNNFHIPAKGCINDYCNNEYEIEYKLRSGHICQSCLQVAVDNSTSIEVLTQVKGYLNFFRDELLEFKSILDTIGIPTLSISADGIISIGRKEINIEYVNRAFYIFSIINRGHEMNFKYLKENHKKLSSIYRTIKKTGSDSPIQTFLGTKVDENGNTLVIRDHEKSKKYIRDRRNEIKTDLKSIIGEELAELFKIGSDKRKIGARFEHYSIFPDNERLRVEIDPEFLEMI